MKHLNCKLYYQQLHLKYWCNLARYWLQAVWGWHDSVETCSSVMILRFKRLQYENWHKTYVKHLNCKLYYQQLHLKYWCNLARYWLQAVWGWHNSVETCSSAIILRFQRLQYENWHKTYVKHVNYKLYYQQLHLKYWCNLARYWLQALWGWHDSVETCSSVIICEIILCICWSAYKIRKYWNMLCWVVRGSLFHEGCWSLTRQKWNGW